MPCILKARGKKIKLISQSIITQSVSPSLSQSINLISLSVCQSVSLSVCQSVSQSVHQSITPSVRQTVHPSIHLSVSQSDNILLLSCYMKHPRNKVFLKIDHAKFDALNDNSLINMDGKHLQPLD